MVAPSEILKACDFFHALKLPIKLVVLESGVMVIESSEFNQIQDFKQNIDKFIDEKNGLTAEFLAKKLGISIIVARTKLEVIYG